jgi:cyanophycin synthetase
MSQCPYCEPYPGEEGHHAERIGIALAHAVGPLVGAAASLERLVPQNERLARVIAESLIRFAVWSGALTAVEASDTDPALPNRSMVVVRAARARGIPVRSLRAFGRRATAHFAIATPQGTRFFDSLPVPESRGLPYPAISYDDKWRFKKFLMCAGLPVPRGIVASNYRQAIRFVESVIGFPAVVKPRAGSLTKHTSVGVKTADGLREAVRIARMVSREFIVEEFIPGEVYRVTLVGSEVAAVCLREAPNVMGDGVHTVRELVAVKNADPRRGNFSNRNVTLHKIVPHPSRDLDHIPSAGEKIYLHDKALMGAGGDVHDMTDRLHPDNRVLCERLAVAAAAPLLGIDLITKDIGVSYKETRLAILEANTVPYIDMHHYPVTGEPHDVAGMLLDAYLESLE